MRLVTIHAPEGQGKKVAELAFESEIPAVSLSQTKLFKRGGAPITADVISFQTSTPRAKEMVENLMTASFYDPLEFSLAIRHPESIFGSELPEKETEPLTRPTTDVYEELWQFCKITPSLIIRVFLAAFLVAFGVRKGFMPLIIAGLLFLPYHHHMLGLALSAGLKEWRLLRQAISVFLTSTLLIMAGGVAMAFLSQPGIKWTAFSETSILFSFIISAAIGTAAGSGSVDDAGRRELIGLAATAHISVYPVWFGLKLVYGFNPSDQPLHLLMIYFLDVVTLVIFATITFKFMKMKGKGIRNFISTLSKK